jgi:hypothetical protein
MVTVTGYWLKRAATGTKRSLATNLQTDVELYMRLHVSLMEK